MPIAYSRIVIRHRFFYPRFYNHLDTPLSQGLQNIDTEETVPNIQFYDGIESKEAESLLCWVIPDMSGSIPDTSGMGDQQP